MLQHMKNIQGSLAFLYKKKNPFFARGLFRRCLMKQS